MPDTPMLQVSQSAIDSIMRERDQANERARNADVYKQKAETQRIDAEKTTARLRADVERLTNQNAALTASLEAASRYVGAEGKNPASGIKPLTSEEYMRLKTAEDTLLQLQREIDGMRADVKRFKEEGPPHLPPLHLIARELYGDLYQIQKHNPVGLHGVFAEEWLRGEGYIEEDRDMRVHLTDKGWGLLDRLAYWQDWKYPKT
jgi:hypothetical protein